MIRFLFPLVYFAFLVIVMINIWDSPYHSRQEKLMWMGLTFFFPGLGILGWLLYGRRKY